MNDEYYYIKIKSIEYDQPDWYMIEDGFSLSPIGIRVFNNIDEAIEVKNHIQKEHNYQVEIERF